MLARQPDTAVAAAAVAAAAAATAAAWLLEAGFGTVAEEQKGGKKEFVKA